MEKVLNRPSSPLKTMDASDLSSARSLKSVVASIPVNSPSDHSLESQPLGRSDVIPLSGSPSGEKDDSISTISSSKPNTTEAVPDPSSFSSNPWSTFTLQPVRRTARTNIGMRRRI